MRFRKWAPSSEEEDSSTAPPLHFEPSLSAGERKFVHAHCEARSSELSSKSEGEGEERHVVVYDAPVEAGMVGGVSAMRRAELTARHFVPGQFVDVQGVTTGKGFQGVMKRWGFKGQPATHGVSLKHRSGGSIGNCQDPGRVWKGRKMPGRMGGKVRTQQNCTLYKIDPVRNLLFLKGAVPGHKGNYVAVSDAVKKVLHPELPWPTFEEETEAEAEALAAALETGDEDLIQDLIADLTINPKEKYN